MNCLDDDENAESRLRIEAARSAAPYVHAKLNSSDVEVNAPSDSDPAYSLTDEELMVIAAGRKVAFILSIAKAMLPSVTHHTCHCRL